VNGPTYNNLSNDFFLDGNDDYINLDNFGSKVNSFNEITEIYWFKTNTTLSNNGGSILLMFYGEDNDPSPYRPVGNFSGGSGNESISMHGDYVRGYHERGNSYFHDNKYHQAVYRIGSNFNNVYVDGNEVNLRYDVGSNLSGFNSVFNNTVTQWRLGLRTTNGYIYGKPFYISMHTVYNRALSDAEIKQNFNALRGRYGI
jgi:hypothetical protein